MPAPSYEPSHVGLDFSAAAKEIRMEFEQDMLLLRRQIVQDLHNTATETLNQRVYQQPPTKSYPKRTGFLRANVWVHEEGFTPPHGERSWNARKAAADAAPPPDFDNIPEEGPVYITWGAFYAGHVEDGTSDLDARRFIQSTAEQWPQIVDGAARKVLGK